MKTRTEITNNLINLYQNVIFHAHFHPTCDRFPGKGKFFYLSKLSKYILLVIRSPLFHSSFLPSSTLWEHVIVYLQPPGQKQYRWDSFSCTKRPVTWLHKENYKVTRTRPNNDLLSTIIIHFRHFHKINHREFTVLLLLTIIVQLDGCVKRYLRGWFSRNW